MTGEPVATGRSDGSLRGRGTVRRRGAIGRGGAASHALARYYRQKYLSHRLAETRGWGRSIRFAVNRGLALVLTGYVEGDVIRHPVIFARLRALDLPVGHTVTVLEATSDTTNSSLRAPCSPGPSGTGRSSATRPAGSRSGSTSTPCCNRSSPGRSTAPSRQPPPRRRGPSSPSRRSTGTEGTDPSGPRPTAFGSANSRRRGVSGWVGRTRAGRAGAASFHQAGAGRPAPGHRPRPSAGSR